MIWLYIKELAGKDLDLNTIMKFIMYGLPKLMPLVLPLTILLTSIMVFGNFAENYEFAAMKSTGISLQRAMAGLSIFIVGLAFVTFWFSNNVIPWGEYNFFNLRKNLAKVKPSMAIAKGQFNEIESTPYNIKVADKSGDRGQYLDKVVIHKKGGKNSSQNVTVIVADRGELVSSEDSDILKLILFDGNFYEDIYKPNSRNDNEKKEPFAKSAFEKYTMNIDLSDLNKVDIDDKSYSNKSNMLNLRELDYTIDSLTVQYDTITYQFGDLLLKRSGINKKPAKVNGVKGLKSKRLKKIKIDTLLSKTVKDTTLTDSLKVKTVPYTGPILDLFDLKQKQTIVNNAFNATNGVEQLIQNKNTRLENRRKLYSRHVIKFHEKLALPFACIILFFVGAPLGALIRKGGLGLPMVVAILLFLVYHFIGIFALNSAKNGSLNPIFASWFSTVIMFPLSIFLTRRATADRGIFDFDGIIIPLKRFLNIKEKEKENFKFLNSFTNEKLLNIITTKDLQNYSEASRFEALKLINKRGLSTQQLRTQQQIAIGENFEIAQHTHNNFKAHSLFAVILYSIAVVLLVLFFILKNNKLENFVAPALQLSIVAFVLFGIYYVKSLMDSNKFYKTFTTPVKTPNPFILYLAFPLYIVAFFMLRLKLKKDLKYNCLNSLK